VKILLQEAKRSILFISVKSSIMAKYLQYILCKKAHRKLCERVMNLLQSIQSLSHRSANKQREKGGLCSMTNTSNGFPQAGSQLTTRQSPLRREK